MACSLEEKKHHEVPEGYQCPLIVNGLDFLRGSYQGLAAAMNGIKIEIQSMRVAGNFRLVCLAQSDTTQRTTGNCVTPRMVGSCSHLLRGSYCHENKSRTYNHTQEKHQNKKIWKKNQSKPRNIVDQYLSREGWWFFFLWHVSLTWTAPVQFTHS